MVCTNCGALIPDHAFKCPSCGRPMRVGEVLASPPALAEHIRYMGVEGWLALLVVYVFASIPLVIAIRIFFAVYAFAAGRPHEGNFLSPGLWWIVDLILAVLGVYAGVALLNRSVNAVFVTKLFLTVLAIAGAGASMAQFHTPADRLWGVAEALIFPAIWFAYLTLSRRVANTYGRDAGYAPLLD
jgi:hypothetical protein